MTRVHDQGPRPHQYNRIDRQEPPVSFREPPQSSVSPSTLPHPGIVTRADRPDSQLLHHRPHRPREIHLADRLLEATATVDRRQMRDQVLDSQRARAGARDHDQAPRHPDAPSCPRWPRVRTQPHRHARPRRLYPTRCPDRWRPARGRSWWWTPPRVSRRKRSPTSSWPSTPIWRSCPFSTRSTFRRGARPATRRSRGSHGHRPGVGFWRRVPRRGWASRRFSMRSSNGFRPRPEMRRHRCER